MEGVAAGGTFTLYTSMLRVRCSLRNSNSSHNSVGSQKWYNCLSIHQYLHNCQEKCVPLLQEESIEPRQSSSIHR